MMRLINALRACAFAAFALSLSACVNLTAAHTHVLNSYQLKGPSLVPDSQAWKKRSLTIAIKQGFVAPNLRSTAMAYELNPYQVSYFVENRWQSLPSIMIVAALAEALQNTHAFAGVVIAPPYAGTVDQVVSVNLLDLTQVFDGSLSHSVEHMVVQLALSDGQTGHLQGVQTFAINVPADGTPQSGVVAANQALQQLLPAMLNTIYRAGG